MQNAARAVMHDGKIELLDDIAIPEGARLVVSVVPEEEEEQERAFWYAAGLPAMRALWDNEDDARYEQLLKE